MSFDSGSGRLQAALDEAVVSSAVCGSDFLPNRQLPKHIHKSSVEAELIRCQDSLLRRIKTRNFDRHVSNEQLSAEAQKICGTVHQSWRSYPDAERGYVPSKSEPREKTYRKIFAILLLIGRPAKIRGFVEEEVCDADLPLEAPSKGSKPWDLRRKKGPSQPLECFKGWRHNTVKRFEKSQWTVLAPYLGQDERKKALFFKIPDRAILPFTTWEKVDSRGRVTGRGGYGQVYKAEIHADHHGFDEDTEGMLPENRLFAVKQLFHQKKEDFRHEFEILRTVSRLGHRHLITLFAAYEQQGYYHLIFPLAEADLMIYWQDNTSRHDACTARWLASQCEGLASGLATIHRYFTRSGESLRDAAAGGGVLPTTPRRTTATCSDRKKHEPRTLFCRHGDIKRENILWFPDPPGSDGKAGRGTLKLTDFGTAELMTHDEVPWTKPLTSPIYRPPEADLPLSDSFIRTSYDIWGLACVYLEFAAWCFGGWRMIEAFLDKRYKHDHQFYKFNTGTFFEVLQGESGVPRAQVKPGVYEVSRMTLHILTLHITA